VLVLYRSGILPLLVYNLQKIFIEPAERKTWEAFCPSKEFRVKDTITVLGRCFEVSNRSLLNDERVAGETVEKAKMLRL